MGPSPFRCARFAYKKSMAQPYYYKVSFPHYQHNIRRAPRFSTNGNPSVDCPETQKDHEDTWWVEPERLFTGMNACIAPRFARGILRGPPVLSTDGDVVSQMRNFAERTVIVGPGGTEQIELLRKGTAANVIGRGVGGMILLDAA